MGAHEFVLENLESVPQLEALILLWNSRPVWWTCEELASRLYVPFDRVTGLLRDLVRLQLVAESGTEPPKFSYYSRSKDQDAMMLLVDEAYRRDLVRISTMLHEKASPAVRDFARAFRFKREQD
jgi:hypothetical protein